MPIPIVPVLIFGNGPVGQTAALLLARWQIPVILMDERPERDPVGSKAICQQRDVLDIWESVGAGALLAREGLTWTTARTFYKGDELFSVTFNDAGKSPFPPFVNISQSRTEEVLDERIAAQPLIDVRWDHRIVGIEQDRDEVRVKCATSLGPTTVVGSYALACPGARGSDIRTMLGVQFDGHTFGDQFLICDLRTELPEWEQERRFYFDPEWNPGRQVLIHPCPDSTFRIDWQVPEDFDIAIDEESGALDARIRKIIGDQAYEVVWQSVYRFHSRIVDRMRVGKVLLAGDGAHLVAPFGARGLNSGVADAENAAWKLAFVLKEWAPDTILDSYHVERHEAAKENLDITGATMRFLVPQNEAERLRRAGTLESAIDDPDARNQVDSGRLAEPFWYASSPLTTPDGRGNLAVRPPKGSTPSPASGVLVPDLPIVVNADPTVTRLRELVRTGVTVLVGAGVNATTVDRGTKGCAAPVSVHTMSSLSGDLAEVLGAGSDQVWVVRPDGHVAAVLVDPSSTEIGDALGRSLGCVASLPSA